MPDLETPAPFEIRRIVNGKLRQVWRPRRSTKAYRIFESRDPKDGVFEFWINGELYASKPEGEA